jgi:hypothetical protein
MFFWTDWSKCSRSKRIFSLEEEKNFVEPPAWVETWSDRLTPISTAIMWSLQFLFKTNFNLSLFFQGWKKIGQIPSTEQKKPISTDTLQYIKSVEGRMWY